MFGGFTFTAAAPAPAPDTIVPDVHGVAHTVLEKAETLEHQPEQHACDVTVKVAQPPLQTICARAAAPAMGGLVTGLLGPV